MLEDLVEPKPFIKTLYRGLRLGHEDNVAIVHPFVFMLRRILFAAAIVFMANHGVIAAVVLQVVCVGVGSFVAVYRPWRDPLINLQHLANEVLLYIVLSLEATMSVTASYEMVQTIGHILIGAIAVTFLLNISVCVYVAV